MTIPVAQTNNFTPLSVRNITPFNVRGTQYIVDVEPDVCIEDLQDPKYWTHVAGTEFKGDIVILHVYWQDRMQYARLFVRDYGHAYAAVEVLEHHKFGKVKPEIAAVVDPKFKAVWQNPSHRYKIVRISDGEVMIPFVDKKDEAAREVAKLEKANK